MSELSSISDFVFFVGLIGDVVVEGKGKMKSEEDSSRSMVIFAVEVSFFLFADLENIGLIHACTKLLC